MPGSQAAGGPRIAVAGESSERWAQALREGGSTEALATEILGTKGSAESIRQLGALVGVAAVPILTQLVLAGKESGAAAAESLGDIRDPSAAAALDELSRSASDRVVQKAVRRSLYRLASQGIKPVPAPPAAAARIVSRQATVYRVVASAYDGNGTRAMWIGAERPLGGIFLIALEINDVHGLTDCVGRDTTRKRFSEQERSMREKDIVAWVELPVNYARQLVGEALGLAREQGAGVPASYATWAETVGEPTVPFERALVYETINAFEVRMHPTLENETPLLFRQPEIEPWFFAPEQVHKYLAQLTQPASSRLLITPESDADRQARIFREAARELLPPRELHGIRRRLEETAYIFLQSGRDVDARRAVAAAATIEDERPLRPPHPFLRTLLERSLDIAAEAERSGVEPFRLARAP